MFTVNGRFYHKLLYCNISDHIHPPHVLMATRPGMQEQNMQPLHFTELEPKYESDVKEDVTPMDLAGVCTHRPCSAKCRERNTSMYKRGNRQ